MTNKNHAWFERACRVLPGGVNSPVRAFGAVGGEPPFVVSGAGPYMYDVDENRYIDLMGSWGPQILGHAHPDIERRLERTLKLGTSFGACNPLEVELAELVCKFVPSVEMVRMTSSGTEATMAAIRLARAATGRALIVKFEGCFHGHSDPLLQSAGSGVATFNLPDALGIPGAISALTKQVPFNDAEAVRELFAEHGEEIAAVILEPVAANMGVVPPNEGFLEALRSVCDEHGALLIFDEVLTGFRVDLGGYQAVSGVTPDLTCMGKVIGGGLPVGAFGGRRELMQQIAPAGGVYHAGTLSGNPLAMAAGIGTLETLAANNGAAYTHLNRLADKLDAHLAKTFAEAGIPARVQRARSLLTVYFTEPDKPVTNFAEAKATDTAFFARYFQAMLAEGVYLPPSNFEAWFLSTAHDDEVLHQICVAHDRALERLS